MCGVAGILLGSGNADVSGYIDAMTSALLHRGPDAGATFVDNDAGVALGHRRLAIVELSDRGAQPMHSANGRYIIVFNGEIYNHLELRRELEVRAEGSWRGSSDTETLIECFAAWGVAATLRKAVGMFAIALWDRKERQLTLARDRFGEKPLYYGYLGNGECSTFVFGSELKALRACARFDNVIDHNVFALYLRYSYVPTPYSIYRDVYKLEPGSIFTIKADEVAARPRNVEKYWRYEDTVTAGLADPILDETEAIDELERVLSEAVSAQLMADVPVGAFLSGGIDSSTIVALMQAHSSRPVRTFTVGFNEAGFDEAPHAREIARYLGTEHHEIRVTPAEARAVIPNLPNMYDEPFGDSSEIPTSIVCSVARREVTVALSGDGGDEMLGGYNRYVIGPKLSKGMASIPSAVRGVLGGAATRLPNFGWSMVSAMPGLGRRLAPFKDKAYKIGPTLGQMENADDLYQALVTEWASEDTPTLGAKRYATRLDDLAFAQPVRDSAERMMLFDGLTYLPDDILVKVDRAAMAVSLETRVPLLDHRVAEIAWRLPVSMKIRDGRGKWALRQILYRHVPRDLVERPKAGFAIPVGLWLRHELRDWADNLLTDQHLKEQGFFDARSVRWLWDEHRSGKSDWTPRLWNILMFQSWLAAQKAA
jgi:asparagine synthase (glutamine-hydrolysing)